MGIEYRFDLHLPAGADLDEALHRGLERGGNLILDSAKNHAPQEDGDLIASGYAEQVSADQMDIGFRVPWAHKQHEFFYYHHPHGGGAKFLEGAMNHSADDVMQAVADEIEQSL